MAREKPQPHIRPHRKGRTHDRSLVELLPKSTESLVARLTSGNTKRYRNGVNRAAGSTYHEIDPETFTREFFAVGSLLATATPAEILAADRKEFDEDGCRITIAQVEELGLSSFESRRDELNEALQSLTREQGYDLAVSAVTDIAAQHSYLLAAGESRLVDALPFARLNGGVFDAPGVVSRKKQIFPALCRALLRAQVQSG